MPIEKIFPKLLWMKCVRIIINGPAGVYLDVLTGLSSKEDRYNPVVEDYKGDFCRTALGGQD